MSSTSAAEPAPEFVDTNVLLYGHDVASVEKQRTAMRLLNDLWARQAGCLSLQVLQEFYVSVTGRLRQPLTPTDAAARVASFTEWKLHFPDKSDLVSAIDLHQRLRVSFWDAMILQSARRMGCRILWTEDLSHGQTYEGVTVRNPFA